MFKIDATKPFLTEALFMERVSQRTFLAHLPDWAVQLRGYAYLASENPPAPAQAAQCEETLRDYGKELITAHAKTFDALGTDGTTNASAALIRYLQSWTTPPNPNLSARDDALGYIASHFNSVGDSRPVVSNTELAEIKEALRLLIPVLDIADALAGDGYRDPRLTRVEAKLDGNQ
jgi:hypothetical protein